jgi:Ser/Thr protein kinase RdoA (MazF antagonist)
MALELLRAQRGAANALAERLDLPLCDVRRVGGPREWSVYEARSHASRVFIKLYEHPERNHARHEAWAFGLAHRIGRRLPGWLGAQVRRVSADGRAVCLEAVGGEALGRTLRRARRDPDARRRCLVAAKHLGTFLASLRRETAAPGTRPQPHLGEYLQHVAESLAGHPLVGRACRRLPRRAESLHHDLERASWTPSFAHGDLTPRNVHVDLRGHVGLIDFAHARARSHSLDDLCALRTWLRGTAVSPRLAANFLAHVDKAMGHPSYPAEVERFYIAFHDWRWAHLALRGSVRMRWRALASLSRVCSLEERSWTRP